MKAKIFILLFLVGIIFIFNNIASAATLPLPGVEIIFKSVKTKYVVVGKADVNGDFNTQVPEENGLFDVYVGDQNMPPVKIVAKGGFIKGRAVVLTEGTTTKDPETPVVKKTTTKKSTSSKKK